MTRVSVNKMTPKILYPNTYNTFTINILTEYKIYQVYRE